MKRIFALFLCVLTLLTLVSCSNSKAEHNVCGHPISNISDAEPDFDVDAEVLLDYGSKQCGWLYSPDENGMWDIALNSDKSSDTEKTHLPIFRFESLDELESFVLRVYPEYDEENPTVFDDDIQKRLFGRVFDEAYFEEFDLIIAYLDESSGTPEYGVKFVYMDGESFCLHVKLTHDQEEHTDDMSGWMFTVSYDKEMGDYRSFDAVMDN